MKIKFHEYEYVDRCHRYDKNGCRITPKVNHTFEADLRLVPRVGEFIEYQSVLMKIDSVLYSLDTDEIEIKLSPVKRPAKQPITES